MKRQHIHFIVNPVSGNGKHRISVTYLSHFFDENAYALTLKNTECIGHATELAIASLREKADVIVACGGDGTISEVARVLVNSQIPLGILPLGSGNGLASNLAISRELKRAILQLKRGVPKSIDVGRINNDYFFSNIGIGFDAEVISHYEKTGGNPFRVYVKSILKSLKNSNSYEEMEVEIEGKAQLIKPFMIFISNTNEMGYKISLTPKAQLNDGLLDVVLIPQINFFEKLRFAFYVLCKKPQAFHKATFLNAKQIVLKSQNVKILLQKDGEKYPTEERLVTISVLHKALRVVC